MVTSPHNSAAAAVATEEEDPQTIWFDRHRSRHNKFPDQHNHVRRYTLFVILVLIDTHVMTALSYWCFWACAFTGPGFFSAR